MTDDAIFGGLRSWNSQFNGSSTRRRSLMVNGERRWGMEAKPVAPLVAPRGLAVEVD